MTVVNKVLECRNLGQMGMFGSRGNIPDNFTAGDF